MGKKKNVALYGTLTTEGLKTVIRHFWARQSLLMDKLHVLFCLHTVGLYNLHASKRPQKAQSNGSAEQPSDYIRSPTVHVSYTLIPLDGETASSVPLSKVLSIRDFLVHVGEFKVRFAMW